MNRCIANPPKLQDSRAASPQAESARAANLALFPHRLAPQQPFLVAVLADRSCPWPSLAGVPRLERGYHTAYVRGAALPGVQPAGSSRHLLTLAPDFPKKNNEQ